MLKTKVTRPITLDEQLECIFWEIEVAKADAACDTANEDLEYQVRRLLPIQESLKKLKR